MEIGEFAPLSVNNPTAIAHVVGTRTKLVSSGASACLHITDMQKGLSANKSFSLGLPL